MIEQRFSDDDRSRRDVPSFIEPRPPLISNPFMRPRPQKATNLLKLFEEDSECEEPELVQVYLRMKPCNIPINLYEVRSDRYLITSLDTTTAGHGRRTQHNVSKMYTFSHIFGPETNQKEIFENVVKDNLKKLPDGHSFTLLTYGASGSGKTYTLMGTVASPGLVPRSLEYVFRVVDAAQQPLYKPSEGGADKLNNAEQDYELQWVRRLRQISAPVRDKYRRMSIQLRSDMPSTIDLSNRTRYYVWVSFVEIYNEGIYDLLAPGDRKNAPKLLIREDSNGTVYVKGATQAFVRTGEEAYNVMVAGKHNLQVAATGVHAESSRSHCIFTITMLTHTDDGVRISCVRLCDLAGCERARRTRNTGARMQESRAINSSLHVLERCLHTLRRKQRAVKQALVPYRESKLTRLLGAGLSGARGEAVSMVVTLNPAPEYAHETRHVLQLAAVARDIQINNTMSEYPSSLETSQDTTLGSGVEVMKLRSENERLHFELIQAQSRNMELMASMEERQAATADTMRSLVEEAKEITRHYYETQLAALRNEMDEMAEEYESRLSQVAMPTTNETQSRALQNKVTELMTEIAILEEKLTAERLARARAEDEVQHLRACIEERDEKDNKDDAISLTDSDKDDDSDSEEDPCNESLEPTFTKEDINRSRLIRQSFLQEQQSTQDDSVNSDDKSEDSILELSTHTIKDNEKNNASLDTYTTDNESELIKKVDEFNDEGDIKRLLRNSSLDSFLDGDSVMKDMKEVEKDKQSLVKNEMDTDSFTIPNKKSNYIDQKAKVKSDVDYIDTDVKHINRGTYFVSDSIVKNEFIIKSEDKQMLSPNINENEKSIDVTNNSNVNYESIIQDYALPVEPSDTKKSMNIQDSRDVIEIQGIKEKSDEINQWIIPRKASDTLVSEIISSLKCTTNSNSSLTQFEQLEQATRDCNSVCNAEVDSRDEFSNIKLLKEKRTYFDDSKKEYQLQISNLVERKTYFDNISGNVPKFVLKRLTDVGNEINNVDDLRSPSIVKEDVANDFEPSTIKKLLGESMSRQPEPVTIAKNKNIVTKKHDSIDVFDSPLAATSTTKQIQNIEKIRESIEKIVINDKDETNIIIPAINIEEPSLYEEDAKQNKPEHAAKTDSYVKEEKPIIKSPKTQNIDASSVSICKNDNTIEAFENIYKNITTPRATEFEFLVDTRKQEVIESHINEALDQQVSTSEKKKYNLRHKSQSKLDKNKTKDEQKINETKKNIDEEVLLVSQAKCESKQSTRRNLRLRKRRNMIDDEWKSEEKEIHRGEKLKDMVNLQTEFSDVTIDVPAPVKQVKDIPSPEKLEKETENVPPMFGVQSCPSKSVTRSRRKLFTPRPEPLEESMQGESGERVRVPRPSYHRPRARRRL